MRLLEIFNQHEFPGGESAAARQIFDLIASQPDLQIGRLNVTSKDWIGPGAPPPWKQALWSFSNPHFLARLRTYQASSPADAWLVHNPFPVASAGLYAEAARFRTPVIQFAHNWRPFSINGSNFIAGRTLAGPLRPHLWREILAGSWRGSRVQTLWLGLILLWLRHSGWFNSVRAWVAVSRFARERLVEAGLPPERVFALRHFWTPRALAPQPADGGHYLFLGRITPEKGIAVLLDAWAKLGKILGAQTPRLVLCGSGPLEGQVARAAAGDPSIRMSGVVAGEEKARLLSGCRAVIVPSVWWEPLGLVVYEAYEHAKPVLAARSGGLAETVIAGETGLVHPPADSGALARDVIRLEADAALRRRMGDAGRAWLEQNTRPERWLDSFRKILAQVLAEKIPGGS